MAKIRCAGTTRAGRRCKHSGTLLHDGAHYCVTHMPCETLPAGIKTCKHTCHLTTPRCCECSDLRLHRSRYMRYIDGLGCSLPVGLRHDGYCGACKDRIGTTGNNVTVRKRLGKRSKVVESIGYDRRNYLDSLAFELNSLPTAEYMYIFRQFDRT